MTVGQRKYVKHCNKSLLFEILVLYRIALFELLKTRQNYIEP